MTESARPVVTNMSFDPSKYDHEVQRVPNDTPLEEILYLLKRDGGVFIKNLIPEADVNQAYGECKERLDSDVEWNGSFCPGKHRSQHTLQDSHTKHAPI